MLGIYIKNIFFQWLPWNENLAVVVYINTILLKFYIIEQIRYQHPIHYLFNASKKNTRKVIFLTLSKRIEQFESQHQIDSQFPQIIIRLNFKKLQPFETFTPP